MKRVFTLLGLMLPITTTTLAQKVDNPLEVGISAGVNIGATAPLPIPSEVEKIYCWNAKFNPSVGLWASYRLGTESNWSINTGLQFERRSFSLSADVKDLAIKKRLDQPIPVNSKLTIPAGDLSASFTGTQHIDMDNYYLTLPLTASYRFADGRFRLYAGGFASLNIAKKFNQSSTGIAKLSIPNFPMEVPQPVNNVSNDFSEYIRPLDLGLRLGGEYYFNANWGVNLRIDYALTRVTKESFYASKDPLRHIYGFIGVNYRIK